MRTRGLYSRGMRAAEVFVADAQEARRRLSPRGRFALVRFEIEIIMIITAVWKPRNSRASPSDSAHRAPEPILRAVNKFQRTPSRGFAQNYGRAKSCCLYSRRKRKDDRPHLV